MRKFFILSLNLVLVLTLLGTLPASAQGPQPPHRRPISVSVSHPPEQVQVDEDDWKKTLPIETSSAPVDEISAQSVTMGASGTSFRQLGTIAGVPYEPYIAHDYLLNGPNGMVIVGTDLYVVEERGARLLKFDITTIDDPETATLAIGYAGIQFAHDDYLSWPRDVALDAGGNIWVAMNGSAIKKFDAAGDWVLTMPDTNPWEWGTDNYHFRNLNGLSFGPGGYLYAVDRDNHRVQVYDVSGSAPDYYATIGESEVQHWDNDGFNYPSQIAFDSSDRMYVLDSDNFRVQRCESSAPWEAWTCTTAFGETGVWTDDPADLTHLYWANGFGMKSDILYIADGGNSRILECDTNVVSLPFSCSLYVDTTIDPDSDFAWAADVAVDGSGKVYVSDYHNHRIQVFYDGGSGAVYQDTIGEKLVPYEFDDERLNNPFGIAVATDGSIYVNESNGYRLIKLDAAGNQVWTVGEAGIWGYDNDHLGNWWGGDFGNPAIAASGRIYFPDTANDRVQIFNPDGTYYDTLGSWGTGNYEFQCPAGIAIHPTNGDIYVTDHCNQRIQVFTAAHVYKGTIGMLGSQGSDNWRFNNPRGVAVDKNSNVYVADSDNHRVQKCVLVTGGYTCSTFVGIEDNVNDDFSHLHPLSVVVDATGRVYVADEWNNRIQVFDSSGAYLTTIAGDWGSMDGQMTGPRGVAVDANGNVYVAEGEDNFRIQKFALGTPGWKQVNINGFGIKENNWIPALAPFGDYLYAGTGNGQIWRSSNGTTWQPVVGNGFDGSGQWMDVLFVFNNQLYAGTANDWDGGQLWRSSDGLNWEVVTPVGFDGAKNQEIMQLATYGNQLYMATWAWYGDGLELWHSPSGDSDDWTQIATGGLDDTGNETLLSLQSFGGYLYASTFNMDTGVEIWRSDTGGTGTWTQVNDDGFGDGGNYEGVLAVLNGYLYAATSHALGDSAQIWRCQVCDGSDWTQVSDPFGNPDVNRSTGLKALNGELFLATAEKCGDGCDKGIKVYRSTNGTTWTESASDGFGNKNNFRTYRSNGMATFNEQIYIGTGNWANGAQIWRATVNGTATFYSSAAQDGWILESSENSNKGGSLNATGTTFILGDNATKRQYRSILSFDTSSLPDQAVIDSVTLRIKKSGKPVGKNPFAVLGKLKADIRKGWFGTSSKLVLSDFQAKPTAASVGIFGKVPSGGWYTAPLNAKGRAKINKTGLTQFRLYFSIDDNNDTVADYMKFLSGNSGTGKPELIINYTLR